MPTLPVLAPTPPPPATLHDADTERLLAAWRHAAAGLEQAITAGGAAELAAARRVAADALARLPRRWRGESLLPGVAGLGDRAGRAAGAAGSPGSEDLDTARRALTLGWPGWLAAMLLVPAWRLAEAPALDDVPAWLWGEYAAWLFAAPEAGGVDVERFSSAWARRLGELDRWVQRNPGSSAVLAAANACLAVPVERAWFAGDDIWRRLRETRGRWWTRLHRPAREPVDPIPLPREGRRLRIGFVAQRFAPGIGLARLLPRIEHLDTKSFEVCLFSSGEPDAVGLPPAFASQDLPPERAQRLALLRHAQLDVLVFVGPLGDAWDEITWLALHRLAPLQVVMDAPWTSGLPEIDLYAAADLPGSAEATGGFTERLGLMRGPAEIFAFGPETMEAGAATRGDLGVPLEATLLASVATPTGVSGGMLSAMAEILLRCPEARWLLVLASGGEAGRDLAELCQRIETVLGPAGVDSARVVVLPWGGSAGQVRPLLAAADVYLDAGGCDSAAWLALALSAGRPVVVAPRSDAVSSAALRQLLEGIGAPELQATNEARYVELATRLARDGGERAVRTKQLEAQLACGPGFLDGLAASDAFGSLIETAFDELTSLGRAEFRQQRDPLRCFGIENLGEVVAAGLEAQRRGDTEAAAFESQLALRSAPDDYRVRHLRGVVLHAQNELSRAVEYLVAAVQHPAAGPEVWLDLARVLRDRGQLAEATQALEVCVRIDPRPVEALFMLLELSELGGGGEPSREVVQHLRNVAPDDPRVLALT